MQLKDKVAIVTGAGKSIGRVTSLRMAREGAALVLAARTASDIDSLAEEIRDEGGKALAVPTDVTDPVQVESMVDRAAREFGQIDIVVNNAGAGPQVASLLKMDIEHWDYVVRVNLHSAMYCSKYALKHMVPRGGNIIQVSSTAAQRGLPGFTPYAASKFGLTGFTRSLANEVGKYNIRVNCLILGHIVTPRQDQWFHDRAETLGTSYQEMKGSITSLSPMDRITTSEEVADTVVFLSSERGRGITGQSLFVASGGWMTL